jgi:hypothetical protein
MARLARKAFKAIKVTPARKGPLALPVMLVLKDRLAVQVFKARKGYKAT